MLAGSEDVAQIHRDILAVFVLVLSSLLHLRQLGIGQFLQILGHAAALAVHVLRS